MVIDPVAFTRNHNSFSNWVVFDVPKFKKLIDIFFVAIVEHDEVATTPRMAHLATVNTFLGLETDRHV